MRKILFTVFVLLFSITAFSQVNTLWTARYNSPDNNSDIPVSIATDANGNVYVSGISSNSVSGEDVITIKYSSDGTQNWIKHYSGPGNNPDKPVKLLLDKDGNVYIGGYGVSSDTDLDLFLLKYSPNGDSLWTITYNGKSNKNDQMSSMVMDNDGNLFLAGATFHDESASDFLTVKVNANGEILWDKTFKGTGSSNDHPTDATADKDGNCIVTGYSLNENNTYDYTTIKYTSSGDVSWIRYFNGNGNGTDIAMGVTVAPTGDIYITGTSPNLNNNKDAVTVKYNSSGVQQWSAIYNGIENKNDEGLLILADNDGNVFVSGISGHDIFTLKYDVNAVLLWSSKFNGIGNSGDHPREMVSDSYGNIYITGLSSNGSDNDFVTIKYNLSGKEAWTAAYNGTGNGIDHSNAVTVDSNGNVYIAGSSIGLGSLFDYVVLKYQQSNTDK